MAVQAKEQIFSRGAMRGPRIKFFENFADEQKDVNDHRNLNDTSQRQEGFIRDAVLCDTPDNLEREDDDGWASSEGRCEKAGAHD